MATAVGNRTSAIDYEFQMARQELKNASPSNVFEVFVKHLDILLSSLPFQTFTQIANDPAVGETALLPANRAFEEMPIDMKQIIEGCFALSDEYIKGKKVSSSICSQPETYAQHKIAEVLGKIVLGKNFVRVIGQAKHPLHFLSASFWNLKQYTHGHQHKV